MHGSKRNHYNSQVEFYLETIYSTVYEKHSFRMEFQECLTVHLFSEVNCVYVALHYWIPMKSIKVK